MAKKMDKTTLLLLAVGGGLAAYYVYTQFAAGSSTTSYPTSGGSLPVTSPSSNSSGVTSQMISDIDNWLPQYNKPAMTTYFNSQASNQDIINLATLIRDYWVPNAPPAPSALVGWWVNLTNQLGLG